ncbi:hypothetical protein K1T71_006689 [Dendrolimus kikuchii]|uniref:Uncharacterized protein n=1 Tax=Dendrolimus kikuchii TaxID=765133 RepID=A0ACC1D1V8_9NEOP|nr:hypothetical protein K1T71_006689 [Dendrolimus kikuchii]
MNSNIGFIGGGNMSTAIGKGIVKSDPSTASKIWVSGPHLKNLIHWSDMGANVTTKNYEVFNNCDIVFLGVKPNILSEAINGCVNGIEKLSNRHVLFVSMLAGISLDNLHEVLKLLAPYAKINVIRIMPNTPMTVGAGVCIYTPDANVSDDQCCLLEKLLNTSGMCEKVQEPMIDTLGTLTGCGPAFMYMVIEALADGAVKQGVPRAVAQRYAAQVLIGSGKMVLESGKHPGLLKDEVCSPGGTTICGVNALENGKLRATMISAIEAAVMRNRELAKH